MLRYFFKVPAGNPVLKVDFTGPDGNPGTGQARFLRFHPYGVGVDSNASTSCYAPPVAGCATGSPYSRTVNGALAGVWEVTVEARRTSDVASTPFTLTASLFGVAITPNPDVIPNAQVGVPVPRSYSFQNNFATFTGNAVGSDLGSARRGVFTIADGELQDYITTIPAGSTSFRATIGSPSDAAADLDLFVYQCSDPSCTTRTLRGQSCRRRLGGVGHDREPRGRHLAGGGRRLRDPGGIDDVQLRRHLRQPGAGHGRSHRSGRDAPRRVHRGQRPAA